MTFNEPFAKLAIPPLEVEIADRASQFAAFLQGLRLLLDQRRVTLSVPMLTRKNAPFRSFFVLGFENLLAQRGLSQSSTGPD